MRKLFNHLYEWMWHVGTRRDSVDLPLKGKAALYRYPSPGSIITKEPLQDYKTPFSESEYNVRYRHPTHNQKQERISQTTISPFKIDPIRKLVLTHLLKESEQSDAAKVAEAKSKFKQYYGYDCEKQLQSKDLNIMNLTKFDRETLRQAYEKEITGQVGQSRLFDLIDKEQTENPDILEFDSLDLFDAPHFQQARIENAYALDKIILSRAEGGVEGLEMKKGSANYWKALDDSNDPENIKKVQGKVGDLEPNNFSIENARIKFDYDKDGNVVNMHRIPPN